MPDNLVLIKTDDGSHTLFVPVLNAHYHSSFGAIQESEFIFINTGLRFALSHLSAGLPVLNVLEIGFGTGLNALLTQIEAERSGKKITYTAMEPYPLREEIWSQLNYPELLCSADYTSVFRKIHLSDWNRSEDVSSFFTLKKIQAGLETFFPEAEYFHLVYFDAFSQDVQPEMWTVEIFKRIFSGLHPGGILVTYSVKGDVVRAMKAAGFVTEKLSGPPGKRHILRAMKQF